MKIVKPKVLVNGLEYQRRLWEKEDADQTFDSTRRTKLLALEKGIVSLAQAFDLHREDGDGYYVEVSSTL